MSAEKKTELISRTPLYNGFFSAERVEFRHQGFDGEWTAPMTREVMHIGNVAAVLLYNPVLDNVVLIEQFRTGAWLTPEISSPTIYECVAGLVENGETPEDCALRESEEEAGCKVKRLRKVFCMMPSPGSLQEYCNLFVGQIDDAKHEGIFGNKDEGEHIRTHVIPAQTAFNMVDRGELVHSLAIILLQWLRIHHQDLRKEWLGELEHQGE